MRKPHSILWYKNMETGEIAADKAVVRSWGLNAPVTLGTYDMQGVLSFNKNICPACTYLPEAGGCIKELNRAATTERGSK